MAAARVAMFHDHYGDADIAAEKQGEPDIATILASLGVKPI